jgi:hypothetical protein
MNCNKCGCAEWVWANIGFTHAKQCTDCGEIYIGNITGKIDKPCVKPWIEITKGQIDECLQHSDNYDFAWAIEHICRLNNGYPPHENFKPEASRSIKWSKPE